LDHSNKTRFSFERPERDLSAFFHRRRATWRSIGDDGGAGVVAFSLPHACWGMWAAAIAYLCIGRRKSGDGQAFCHLTEFVEIPAGRA